MYLPTLSNAELIRFAEQTQDDLTTSDLERELTKRLAAVEDNELLNFLAEKEIDDADDLRGVFEEADRAEDGRLDLLVAEGINDEAALAHYFAKVAEAVAALEERCA